ncbi:MAG: hypothetical protein IJ570_02370 [Prevotella sp.]|nr:hypothetical protein [Prevotella sp.]
MQKTILLTTMLLLLATLPGNAQQTSMRIHYKDGSHSDVPISDIDSLSFVSGSNTADEATLTGTWVWGSRQLGYYEVLTLLDDFTYTAYDNLFSYGFDAYTYGFYARYGMMLTLWSNGYGYQRRYQWFLTALTENALSVLTREGPFTYYRLQPGDFALGLNDDPQPLPDGTTVVFSDGFTVDTTADGRLQPLMPGTTYVLLHTASTNLTWARKVVVE